jgi:hypothetical protein
MRILGLSIKSGKVSEARHSGASWMRPSALQHQQSRNADLNHASLNKKDEFFTQYEDIAKEIWEYSAELKGKVVLCNCDNPFESEFIRFFILHFNELKLGGLIATCYHQGPVLANTRSTKSHLGAFKATITNVPVRGIIQPDKTQNINKLLKLPGNSLSLLNGDGDFRSEECLSILKQADIVITNPPFSLFREYVSILELHKMKYIILGNMNASTYREIFPLFSTNKLWYGYSIRSGDRKFYVPEDYPLEAAGCGVDENGRRYIRVKGVRWFTNVNVKKAMGCITLTKKYAKRDFPKYQNYNAIEVGRTENIPCDYTGVMGVPITFLDRYNPDQFNIIMLANGNTRTNVPPAILAEVGYRPHPSDKGGVGIINGCRTYARILIRRKIS